MGTLKQRGPGAEKCAALVGVADTEQPAGAQNTPQFVECDVGIREVVEDAVGEHGVEGCIVEAQFGQVTLLEGHVRRGPMEQPWTIASVIGRNLLPQQSAMATDEAN